MIAVLWVPLDFIMKTRRFLLTSVQTKTQELEFRSIIIRVMRFWLCSKHIVAAFLTKLIRGNKEMVSWQRCAKINTELYWFETETCKMPDLRIADEICFFLLKSLSELADFSSLSSSLHCKNWNLSTMKYLKSTYSFLVVSFDVVCCLYVCFMQVAFTVAWHI